MTQLEHNRYFVTEFLTFNKVPRQFPTAVQSPRHPP